MILFTKMREYELKIEFSFIPWFLLNYNSLSFHTNKSEFLRNPQSLTHEAFIKKELIPFHLLYVLPKVVSYQNSYTVKTHVHSIKSVAGSEYQDSFGTISNIWDYQI